MAKDDDIIDFELKDGVYVPRTAKAAASTPPPSPKKKVKRVFVLYYGTKAKPAQGPQAQAQVQTEDPAVAVGLFGCLVALLCIIVFFAWLAWKIVSGVVMWVLSFITFPMQFLAGMLGMGAWKTTFLYAGIVMTIAIIDKLGNRKASTEVIFAGAWCLYTLLGLIGFAHWLFFT